MNYCSNCGHELGVGRYCTNCGQPVTAGGTPDPAWRTDTAERVAVPDGPPPSEPPPSHAPPPPARFPLFADEAEEAPYLDDAFEEELGYDATAYDDGSAQHRRRVWWPWLVGAAAVLVVVGVGLLLLTGGDGDDTAARPGSSSSPQTGPRDHGGREHRPSGGGSSDASSDASPDVPAGDLASSSTVTVPATAPPGQDADGNPTTYEADHLLDGDPSTAWRMPGDGSGEELVITLPGETHLTSVGLVNGYAKTADGIDWYHANRRLQSVQWVFDDGSTTDQQLADSTELQSVDVDVTTTTVTLRLVTVSPPGRGSMRRDYTAISDLSLVGG